MTDHHSESKRYMDFVNVARYRSNHRNCLLVTTSKCDLCSCNRAVCFDPLVFNYIDTNHDSRVFEGLISNATVTISIPTIVVRVEVSVCTVTRVEAVRRLPAIWHSVKIGVHAPWRGEVRWSEDVCNLVLFVVVHAVFIPVAVSI